MSQRSVSKRILAIRSGQPSWVDDQVVIEQAIDIIVGERKHATLLCTPEHVDEMVIGYLWWQGLVDPRASRDALPAVRHEEATSAANVMWPGARQPGDHPRSDLETTGTPAQAGDAPAPSPVFAWDSVLQAVNALETANRLFVETGGAHACGAWRDDALLVIREDVSRHCALDKVAGHLLMQDLDPASCLLVLTSRVSESIADKVAVFGFRVIASRAAPTDKGIQVCEEHGITLAGFCRGSRMNVYAYPERIVRS